MRQCGRWNATVTSVFAKSFLKKIILLQGEEYKKNPYYFVCFKPLSSSVHFVLQKQECKKPSPLRESELRRSQIKICCNLLFSEKQRVFCTIAFRNKQQELWELIVFFSYHLIERLAVGVLRTVLSRTTTWSSIQGSFSSVKRRY